MKPSAVGHAAQREATTELVAVHAPSGWETVDGGRCFVPTDAPDPIGPLTPCFSAVTRPAVDWASHADVRAGHAPGLLAELVRPRLLDDGETELDDCTASRVLVAHRVDGDDVTLEHWVVFAGRSVVVLAATAPTLEYFERFPDFQEFIGGVTIDA